MDTHHSPQQPAIFPRTPSRRETFSRVPTLDQLLRSRPEIQSPRKPKEQLLFTPSQPTSKRANSSKAPRADSLPSRTEPRPSREKLALYAPQSARQERRTTAYWRSVGMFVEDSEGERRPGPLTESESDEEASGYGLRRGPIDLRQPAMDRSPVPRPKKQASVDPDAAELSSDDSLPSPRALLFSVDLFSPSSSKKGKKQRSKSPAVTRMSTGVEIIELLSSDDEVAPVITLSKTSSASTSASRFPSPNIFDDDEGMLFFVPSRRPTKRPQATLPTSTTCMPSVPKTPATLHHRDKQRPSKNGTDECILLLSSSEDEQPSSPRKTTARPRARKTPSKYNIDTPRKTPGRGRKALQAQLERLAEETVSQLNTRVFDGRIPEDMELIWSKRLNTTAGRANWKRIRKESGDDVHQCSIELSTKVLDSEERVLNTVAHELCHLAAWVINGEIQPAHGRCFKAWGRKVMKCRPDIQITTRHDYEIAYKYEWRCANPTCARTYGRHSKSINPDQHACGVCKGRLEPMFQTYSPSKRTAFQDYLKEHMKALKAAEPGMTHGELMKELSRRFKEDKAKTASSTDDLVDRFSGINLSSAPTSAIDMPGEL